MTDWKKANSTLIGVPLDLGAKNLGVDIGPEAFRHHNLINKLASAGITVSDSGDITPGNRNDLDPGDPKLRYIDEIIRVSNELATKTEQIVSAGNRAILIGGDHSINLGAVSGASSSLSGNLGMIYLDAHGDMNTHETTSTGNIHGMHLASLLGLGDERLINVHKPGPKIKSSDLLHIGGSDLDQPEIELMEKMPIPNFKLVDLMLDGMRPLFKKIDELNSRVENIWISLDLDVIDRLYAPGAGMPNPGGLTYREILAIADYVGNKSNVVGIDVVEYNPLQDEDKKTAELGIELIAKFFGRTYSWYTGYLESNKI